MRKLLALITTVGLLVGLAPVAAAGPRPFCGLVWGSQPKTDGAHPDTVIVNARAGRHACFDRFVVDVDGAAPGYRVEYVDAYVPDASGQVASLRGGAALQLTLLGARAHDGAGNATYRPADRSEMVSVAGFRTLRQAYWGGTFEATTTIGLGVRARLPFRVFTLAGPGSHSRVVVDVAHRW